MPVNQFYREDARPAHKASATNLAYYRSVPSLGDTEFVLFVADIVAAFISIGLWVELIIAVWYLVCYNS